MVQSDLLRYWLEEAQELELLKDEKYDKLNDMVEDIDRVVRAMHNCASEL